VTAQYGSPLMYEIDYPNKIVELKVLDGVAAILSKNEDGSENIEIKNLESGKLYL
jgi:hypothetical protein